MIQILLLFAAIATALGAKGERFKEKLGQQRLMDMQALEHKSERDNIIVMSDVSTY